MGVDVFTLPPPRRFIQFETVNDDIVKDSTFSRLFSLLPFRSIRDGDAYDSIQDVTS